MADTVAARPRRRLVASPAAWLIWGAVAFFLVNLAGVIGAVLVSSFGTQWFGTWLPSGFTTGWYSTAWREFGLLQVVGVTLQVSLLVVVISLLIGVPAAYVLARRTFPGKKIVYFAFLLPILMPPITYGIPLATVLYKYGFAGNASGVVLANLVPSVPFVILTMTPFIEQINPSIESAARMCGAGTRALFVRVLGPAARTGHPRGGDPGAGAHRGNVRADVPHRRPRLADAGGRALLLDVGGRNPGAAVRRRDGRDLHRRRCSCCSSSRCGSSIRLSWSPGSRRHRNRDDGRAPPLQGDPGPDRPRRAHRHPAPRRRGRHRAPRHRRVPPGPPGRLHRGGDGGRGRRALGDLRGDAALARRRRPAGPAGRALRRARGKRRRPLGPRGRLGARGGAGGRAAGAGAVADRGRGRPRGDPDRHGEGLSARPRRRARPARRGGAGRPGRHRRTGHGDRPAGAWPAGTPAAPRCTDHRAVVRQPRGQRRGGPRARGGLLRRAAHCGGRAAAGVGGLVGVVPEQHGRPDRARHHRRRPRAGPPPARACATTGWWWPSRSASG